jgi:sugar phosphate isomerase/epimerase
MKIGACSFAFGPKSLKDSGHIIKDFGFSLVDIGACLGNTQIHPVRAAEEPARTALEAVKVLSELNLEPDECFVLDFGEPINHPEESIRKKTRRLFPGLVKFACAVGCRSIMLVPGVVHPHLGKEKSFDLSLQELRELVKISDEAGIMLNIEPCEPSVAEDPKDALVLCQEAPGLGLTLDYSHFVDPGYDQAAVEPLHQFTRHLHARQASPGKRVERVEKGTIDFGRIIWLLRQQGFNGNIAVEYVDCDVTRQCDVDVMEETPKMKQLLETLIRNNSADR